MLKTNYFSVYIYRLTRRGLSNYRKIEKNQSAKTSEKNQSQKSSSCSISLIESCIISRSLVK